MSIKEDMLSYSPPEVSILRPKNLVGFAPGFFCGDRMMTNLGTSISNAGCDIFYSGIVSNFGWTSFQMALFTQRFLSATRSGRKTDLVGHSLGGIYAIYLAEKYPERVRKVVTLGTPNLKHPRQAAHPLTRAFGDFYLYDDLGVFKRADKMPEGVEFHSIYTKQDEVIDYKSCLDPRFNLHQSSGSHIDLPNNRHVQKIVNQILSESC